MLQSKIPEVQRRSAILMQKAVHVAGGEIEFKALQVMEQRRQSGKEVTSTRWVPSRRDPYKGEVKAGAFYTRFSEYGTVFQVARPVLGPAAEEVQPKFWLDARMAWRV